ncbi:MAG: FHA domain-containing protein [bacterium]|nr:FHA domain-containing protein [bacterium]
MRKWNRSRIVCLAVLICLVGAAFPASASGNARIVEKTTTQERIILYVKGLEEAVWEAAYQAGKDACVVEEIDKVRASGEAIYTLILWDHSLSVMNRQGDRIRDMLLDIMANRASEEKFAIALIGADTTYLTEYTDDYAVLKRTVEAVDGQNQDAYIIENLYEAILSLNQMPDTGYKRIILISDGMDAVEIGYSKAELDALLEKTPYPIYTIGMLDSSHTEELQNMFALSRSTGAEYFYMDELEDLSVVAQSLGADLNIYRISIFVPEEMRDGSIRNSQLVLKAGSADCTLQCQVTLPFVEARSDDGAGQRDTDGRQDDSGVQEGEQDETDDAPRESRSSEEGASAPTQADAGESFLDNGSSVLMIGSIAGAAVLIFIVVTVILFVKKKKKKEKKEDHYAQLDDRLKNGHYRVSDEKVGALSGEAGNKEPDTLPGTGYGDIGNSSGMEQGAFGENTGGGTRLLFAHPLRAEDQMQSVGNLRRVLLTDTANAVRTYECGISDRVVIGRKAACCNLAIVSDNAVSERHCEMEYRGGRFYIRDLGSSNGTHVNGTKITEPTEIQTGDIIKIGRAQYRLTLG